MGEESCSTTIFGTDGRCSTYHGVGLLDASKVVRVARSNVPVGRACRNRPLALDIRSMAWRQVVVLVAGGITGRKADGVLKFTCLILNFGLACRSSTLQTALCTSRFATLASSPKYPPSSLLPTHLRLVHLDSFMGLRAAGVTVATSFLLG